MFDAHFDDGKKYVSILCIVVDILVRFSFVFYGEKSFRIRKENNLSRFSLISYFPYEMLCEWEILYENFWALIIKLCRMSHISERAEVENNCEEVNLEAEEINFSSSPLILAFFVYFSVSISRRRHHHSTCSSDVDFFMWIKSSHVVECFSYKYPSANSNWVKLLYVWFWFVMLCIKISIFASSAWINTSKKNLISVSEKQWISILRNIFSFCVCYFRD